MTAMDFPSAPTTGDTYNGYQWDGEKWIAVGGSGGGGGDESGGGATVITSDTPPQGAPTNALWWHSTIGKMFINYGDADSVQWVEAVKLDIPEPPVAVEEAPVDISGFSYVRRNRRWVKSASVGYLWGGTLWTGANQSVPGFSLSAGVCTDSDHRFMMKIPSGWKSTQPFAMGMTGQGGLMDAPNNNVLQPSLWYRVYCIGTDIGINDIMFTPENIWQPPVGFSFYRRIGMIKSNAAGTGIELFYQSGNNFFWMTPKLDKVITAPTGAVEVITPISAPGMFGFEAFGTVTLTTGAAAAGHLLMASSGIYDNQPTTLPDDGSVAWTVSAGPNSRATGSWHLPSWGMPDTGSIDSIHSTVNPDTVRIFTHGWVDPRGTQDSREGQTTARRKQITRREQWL